MKLSDGFIFDREDGDSFARVVVVPGDIVVRADRIECGGRTAEASVGG